MNAIDHFPISITSGRAIVWLAGELDIFTAPRLRTAFAEATDRARTGVIADLSGVSFIDACTLGVLVGAGNRASHLPAGLRLAGVPAHADKLLRITGLLGSLPSAYPPVGPASPVRHTDPAGKSSSPVPRQARPEAQLAASQ